MRGFLVTVLVCALAAAQVAAQDMPGAVIELQYQPTARAQVALWIEDANGNFLATVRLTEAVAFRGIGNRPGASEMNSGYRWPYGRREGVLPVWASRRASAAGARAFHRVIFQDRVEGLASRTTNDQSEDKYFCLQFDASKSSRDQLDAVSCATKFSSDKGRYLTASDESDHYGEPYEPVGSRTGTRVPMPALSLYPPRMDVTRCTSSVCFDHADVASYADDVRAVMPDIDVVTSATAPGDVTQKVLFTIPPSWPGGDYVAWLEVNVEGDYDATWSAAAYPTPMSPTSDWDSWARGYGYPYRGQPSIVFEVPFTLEAIGEDTFSTDVPAGRSSWDVWSAAYGALASATDITDDPSGAPGSGADRLRRDANGHRFVVRTNVLATLPEPMPLDGGLIDAGAELPDGGVGAAAGSGAGAAGSGNQDPRTHGGGSASGGSGGTTQPGEDDGKGVIIPNTGGGVDGPVGAIYDLQLSHHHDRLRAHTWIDVSFRAAAAQLPIHSYDVRIATEPIVDEATFIRNGRPAKNATDDVEGATQLMVPTDVPGGEMIDTAIGDLTATTHYYVAVRATDQLNRHGPISVADISTLARRFATVTPCFIATAAYGSPLAAEIDLLRRLRDRYLLTNAPGRALVAGYYAIGPALARVVAPHESLRAGVRALLSPLVAALRFAFDEPAAAAPLVRERR